MPECRIHSRKDTVICAGDMDKYIIVEIRTLQVPEDDEVDYRIELKAEQPFYAMLETVRGETVFDEINIEQVVTHKFYIHYIPDVTFERFVLFNGERYRIVNVTNLNERNQFYVLRCNLRGSADLPAGVN